MQTLQTAACDITAPSGTVDGLLSDSSTLQYSFISGSTNRRQIDCPFSSSDWSCASRWSFYFVYIAAVLAEAPEEITSSVGLPL